MKPFVSVLLALILALSVTGCWGDETPASRPVPTPRPASPSSTVMPPAASRPAASFLPGDSTPGSVPPASAF